MNNKVVNIKEFREKKAKSKEAESRKKVLDKILKEAEKLNW